MALVLLPCQMFTRPPVMMEHQKGGQTSSDMLFIPSLIKFC